jgi:hypothetical protein
VKRTSLLHAVVLMIAAPLLPAQVQTAPAEDTPPVMLQAPVDHSELLRRDVVLYQDGFALVEEQRRLAGGTRSHELGGLLPTLRPETLVVSADDGIRLTDVVLRATPSGEELLRRFVGRPVILAPKAGVAASERQAVLIGVDGDVPMVLADGRVEFGGTDAPWRIVLPVAEATAVAPLLLRLEQPDGGAIRLSYIADGLGWQASHVVTLDGDRARLEARALVHNGTAASLPEAGLTLVAGEVAAAAAPAFAPEMALRMASGDANERGSLPVGGWQTYRPEGTHELGAGSHRPLALFSQDDLELRRRYHVSGRGDLIIEPGTSPMPVSVELEIPLPADTPALPGGLVQVRDRDADGRLRFLGSDYIDPAAPGTTLSLTLGQAFDVSAQRTRTHYRQIGDRQYEIGWRIGIENTGSDPAVVEVEEQLAGDWSLIDGEGWTRTDAGTLTRTVELAAGERVELNYQVRVTR